MEKSGGQTLIMWPNLITIPNMEQTDIMRNGDVVTYDRLCNTLEKRFHLMKPETNLNCATFYLWLTKNVIVMKKEKSGL